MCFVFFMQLGHDGEKLSKERVVDHFLSCFCEPQEWTHKLDHLDACMCQLLGLQKPFDTLGKHEGSHVCAYQLMCNF